MKKKIIAWYELLLNHAFIIRMKSYFSINYRDKLLRLRMLRVLSMLNPNRINLSQVSKKLGVSDVRTARKWLKKRNIPILREGRSYTVFEWDVDLAIQSELVESMKKLYPATWHEIYKAGSSDDNMMRAVLVIHPPISKTRKFR